MKKKNGRNTAENKQMLEVFGEILGYFLFCPWLLSQISHWIKCVVWVLRENGYIFLMLIIQM